MQPDVLGLNCATGPREMTEHLRYLSPYSPVPISVLPNAGLPSVVDGHTHYDLTPADLAEHHARFITELRRADRRRLLRHHAGAHRRRVEAVPRPRAGAAAPVRGAVGVVDLLAGADPSGQLVPHHRRAHERQRFQGVPRRHAGRRLGHVRDRWRATRSARAPTCSTCASTTSGATAPPTWTRSRSRFATQASVPLVLDSTEPPVLEAALAAHRRPRHPQLGQPRGRRAARQPHGPGLHLARDYGAAVICLLIDERGQARDVEWKMEIAHRIAPDRDGALRPGAVGPHLRRAHLPAVDRRRRPPPRRHQHHRGHPPHQGRDPRRLHRARRVERVVRPLTGGPPRPQLGLPARVRRGRARRRHRARRPHHAAEPHPGRAARGRARPRLRPPARPATTRWPTSSTCSPTCSTSAAEKEDRSGWPVEERLKARIIDGDRDGLIADLDEGLDAGWAPLGLVNDVLLDGMRTVGELFGSGQMQLPFVLQSAETMKMAVAHLEPLMERVEGQTSKGRLVLATVKGDVHDIGKNLVDIILTNNGYEVFNLGIKVPIADMVAKVKEVDADAIGMSGLLVKSTLIIRDNLQELNDLGLAVGAGPPRWGGPDAHVRREGPARDLRGSGVLRPRRVRGSPHDGPAHDDEAQRRRRPGLRPGAVRPDAAEAGVAAGGRGRSGHHPGPVPVGRDRQPRVRAAVHRVAPRQGRVARRDRRVRQRDGAVPQPVAVPARERRGRRGVQGPHPAASCGRCSSTSRPRACSCRRSSTATGRVNATATTSSCGPTSRARARPPGSAFPASGVEPWLCIADFFRPDGVR